MSSRDNSSLIHFDAKNQRFISDESTTDSSDRVKLRAIKFLNTDHPLAKFIQELFSDGIISESDRDMLLVWTEGFATRSPIDQTIVDTVIEEIKACGLEEVIEDEKNAWYNMTHIEAKRWGNRNLPDYYQKLLEDYPVDATKVTAFDPDEAEEVQESIASLIDEEMINFWHYLVISFRIARLSFHGKKTLASKIKSLFKKN